MDYPGDRRRRGARLQLFREPVNHLIRLHFARSEETLEQALDRLAKLAALLH